MNNKEFDAVVKLPAPKRYEYFIKKVADYEEVWGLFHDGWAMAQDNEGNVVIPFWPKREFAEVCATAQWANFSPKSIQLDDFIGKWLPGMKKDKVKSAVFYTTYEVGVVVELTRLLDDLNQELQNY